MQVISGVMCSSQKLLPLLCGQLLEVNTIVHHFKNFALVSKEEERKLTETDNKSKSPQEFKVANIFILTVGLFGYLCVKGHW